MVESLIVLETESTNGAGGMPSPQVARRLTTAADWASEIRKLLERGKSSTVDLARTVYRAKTSLHYGQWSELWAEHRMPFSKSKADAFALIGRQFGELDSQTLGNLPAGWSILYQLARLERADFKALIDEGKIHPGLKLAEAKELVARFKGQAAAKGQGPNIKQRLRHLQDYVRRISVECTAAQRDMVRAKLCQLALDLKNSDVPVLSVNRLFPDGNSLATSSPNN